MAGSLFHGQSFTKVEYIGNDGLPHYELTPVNGNVEVVSNSNWAEVKNHAAKYGIEKFSWPEFDDAIDVPLNEVRSLCSQLSPLLMSLPSYEVEDLEWLRVLVEAAKRGELYFFAIA